MAEDVVAVGMTVGFSLGLLCGGYCPPLVACVSLWVWAVVAHGG